MASTGIGSRGIIPVFQLKGEYAIPITTKAMRKRNVINRCSRKYFTSLLNINEREFENEREFDNLKMKENLKMCQFENERKFENV